MIEVPDGWGSQADVTCILQTAAAFRDPARLVEVYHEVSHLWNVPATDLPSPRWDEGLATFLQFRMADERDGTTRLWDLQGGSRQLGPAGEELTSITWAP